MLDWRCILKYWCTTEIQAFDTSNYHILTEKLLFFFGKHHFLLKSSNIFHGKIRCMLFIPKSPLGFGGFHLGKKRCHGGFLFVGFWHRTPKGFTEFWGEKNGMFRRNHKKGCSNLKKDALFRNVWRNLLTSVSNDNILERIYYIHQKKGATLWFWGFWGIAPHLGSENTSSPGSLADPQYHKGRWIVWDSLGSSPFFSGRSMLTGWLVVDF